MLLSAFLHGNYERQYLNIRRWHFLRIKYLLIAYSNRFFLIDQKMFTKECNEKKYHVFQSVKKLHCQKFALGIVSRTFIN